MIINFGRFGGICVAGTAIKETACCGMSSFCVLYRGIFLPLAFVKIYRYNTS